MEYKAYLIQAGEGCDHTISCGKKLIDVPGENIDRAIANLNKIILEEYDNDETSLEEVLLLCVSKTHTINVHELYFKNEEEKSEKEEQEVQAKELAEYERLHKKYGKNT